MLAQDCHVNLRDTHAYDYSVSKANNDFLVLSRYGLIEGLLHTTGILIVMDICRFISYITSGTPARVMSSLACAPSYSASCAQLCLRVTATR